MAEDSLTTNVLADKATIWDCLLTFADRPDRYVPGVSDVEILDRFADGLTRRSRQGGALVTEDVSIDAENGRIAVVPRDHPGYEGRIALVLSGPDDAPFVTVDAIWAERNGAAAPDLMTPLQTALMTVKSQAEDL